MSTEDIKEIEDVKGDQDQNEQQDEVKTGQVFPLELLDMAINNKVWVIMREQQEFVGTLRGFDDFMNIVMDNVMHYWFGKDGEKKLVAQLGSILLQGTHVVMVVPAGPDDEEEGNNEEVKE